jgi:3-oxoacyl-[acyl-carrier protein] reductase
MTEERVTERGVAFVTGASRGIGRAVALALARAGYDIAGLARPGTGTGSGGLETLARAVAAEDASFLAVEADVADLAAHDEIVASVLRRYGRIDVFTSNAGVAPSPRRDLLEMTPESFDRVVSVNLRGALVLAQRVARHMISTPAAARARRPVIVFVTSVSAERSSTDRAEYCISKAGLGMAARVFADRLAGEGVAVFEVRPGIVRTDMTAAAREKYDRLIAEGLIPQGRWGEPDDVARAVVALARGDFGYSTGMIVDVSGGLSIPRL